MAKASKVALTSRVDEVLRLILAGAEFHDIKQVASTQNWLVSDRQVRRYISLAYKRFAKVSERERGELLGRHIAQRRALYAKATKAGDLRTAIQILRDEASLEGLYEPHENPRLSVANEPGLNRRERVARRIMAESTGDKTELRLIDNSSPFLLYRLTDTMMPTQLLHIMALMYVNEQLEEAAGFMNSLWCAIGFGDDDGSWDLISNACAYRFAIGREGWKLFAEWLGVDGDYLVKGNYAGHMLDVYGDKICELAPTTEYLRGLFDARGTPSGDFKTAESLFLSWRRLFQRVCRD